MQQRNIHRQRDRRLIIWKGIPYATQPVGKLRWKKPLPAADDDGVYDLTNISKQYPDIVFVSIDYRLGFMGFMNFERVPGGSEDG